MALVRAAVGLAADRAETVRRIAAVPPGTPGRDRALGVLASAAWVEQVLLWVGWRLVTARVAARTCAPPAAVGRFGSTLHTVTKSSLRDEWDRNCARDS
jgi:hypothetical protein